MESEIEVVQPKPGRWGGWATVGYGLIIFVGWFATQTVVGIIFAIIYAIRELSSNPGQDIYRLANSLGNNGQLLSIATLVSTVAGIGLIVLFVKIRKSLTVWEYLGLSRMSMKTILTTVLVFFGLIGIALILGQFTGGSARDTAFATEAYQTSVWPVLFGIAVVIFAPAFEEAFFRGFLFAGLTQSRLGGVGTILLTSLTWAGLHVQYDYTGMATILILGLVLGAVRLRTGSLWAAFLIHASWNLVAVITTVISIK